MGRPIERRTHYGRERYAIDRMLSVVLADAVQSSPWKAETAELLRRLGTQFEIADARLDAQRKKSSEDDDDNAEPSSSDSSDSSDEDDDVETSAQEIRRRDERERAAPRRRMKAS